MRAGRKRSHALVVLLAVAVIGCAAVLTTRFVQDSLSMMRTFRSLQAKVKQTETRSSRLEEENKNLDQRLQAMDGLVKRLMAPAAWVDPIGPRQAGDQQGFPTMDASTTHVPDEGGDTLGQSERENGIGADGKYHWYVDKAGDMLGWHTFRKKAPENEASDPEMLVKAEEKYEENIRTRGPWPRNRQEGYDFYTRAFYPCRSEENIGNPGWSPEGGKWMCELDQLKARDIVYSVGSCGDTGFENAINERCPQCEIHTFDHSLDADTANRLANMGSLHFHDWGLASPTNLKPKLRTLPDIMQELKHEHINIFKIDCEGCEWGLFEHFLTEKDKSFAPFDQIQVELHDLFDFEQEGSAEYTVKRYATATERLNDFIKNLEDHGYRLFHWELNFQNFNCAELAFIHERVVRPPTTTT